MQALFFDGTHSKPFKVEFQVINEQIVFVHGNQNYFWDLAKLEKRPYGQKEVIIIFENYQLIIKKTDDPLTKIQKKSQIKLLFLGLAIGSMGIFIFLLLLPHLTNLIPNHWLEKLSQPTVENLMQYKCYDGQYSIQENNQTYKIVFISYGISNAFAVPGNQIFFTSSMIKEFKNQEEFFMVLAHEIGHHHHQHHKKSFLLNFLLEFIMSIFSPSNTDSLNQIIKMLASGQFSKKDELEADQYSVNMLKKYQVDIKKASSFFKRLDQKEGSLSKWMNLTHPDHQDRFKLFHDVQQNVPFKQYLTDMEWNKIKSMCSY